jgi:beta-lactam-binding protein with PASTA domain/predicted Ser/Thr protein kinase
MATITPGMIIDDRYRVVSRVGSGGMAEVYAVEDLQLGRRIALKVLHERFAQDKDFVERFRREAKSAASLSHANVVSVYDSGEWQGTYYIAMELLEGRSLDQIVREEAPLTPERAIEITEQVLRAARFAHRNGIIHRDLKPHNVIIDSEGRVKVTDFGIARAASSSEITQTGSIMGTARYLSPEQAQGEPSGPSADLYAIGILLYELLTGTVPFEGDSVVAIALRHLSEPPRPPSRLVSSISPNLDAIVLKALAKDPVNRFADADEFLAALAGERERLRAEDGSRTASLAPLALPAVVAPPVGTITQTLPSGAAVAAYSEPTYWDSTSQTSIVGPPGPPADGRGPVWPWALLAAAILGAGIVAAVLLLNHANKTVPAVQGDTQNQAFQTLAGAGFHVAPKNQTSTAPAGIVIQQNPQAGTAVASGSTVVIVVSSGPPPGTVPNVLGEPEAVAKSHLLHDGYRYSTSSTNSTAVKAGDVVSTTPAAGSSANRGSVVQLVISTGAPNVSLPNVVGLTYANAKTVLLANGFKVSEVKQPNEFAPGQVLAQSPNSAKAPQGSTVILTVSSAPNRILVPDEVGQTESNAVQALQALGLSVTTTQVTVTNPANNGLVVRELPHPGSRVKKDYPVTLEIGNYTSSTGQSGTGQSGTTNTGQSGTTGASGST